MILALPLAHLPKNALERLISVQMAGLSLVQLIEGSNMSEVTIFGKSVRAE